MAPTRQMHRHGDPGTIAKGCQPFVPGPCVVLNVRGLIPRQRRALALAMLHHWITSAARQILEFGQIRRRRVVDAVEERAPADDIDSDEGRYRFESRFAKLISPRRNSSRDRDDRISTLSPAITNVDSWFPTSILNGGGTARKRGRKDFEFSRNQRTRRIIGEVVARAL